MSARQRINCRRIIVISAGIFIVSGLVTLSLGGIGAVYYHAAGPALCARCHEIQPAHDSWLESSHRNVSCSACHGDPLTFDWRVHLQKAHELLAHLRGDFEEPVRISFHNLMVTQERCIACHQQEGADWRAGPHSADYARIFLDETRNSTRVLTDDSLRPHGMHFPGGIQDLVANSANGEPRCLLDPRLKTMPTMPCMTCHQIHTPGAPLPPYGADERNEEIARPSLAFFDYQKRAHIPLAALPMPDIYNGSWRVDINADPRQVLCYQCHAPEPHPQPQAGSGDDRTCVGVHEGISCLTCHQKHRQTTRNACDICHPRFSPGLDDVKDMDTTFRSRDSERDIHTLTME